MKNLCDESSITFLKERGWKLCPPSLRSPSSLTRPRYFHPCTLSTSLLHRVTSVQHRYVHTAALNNTMRHVYVGAMYAVNHCVFVCSRDTDDPETGSRSFGFFPPRQWFTASQTGRIFLSRDIFSFFFFFYFISYHAGKFYQTLYTHTGFIRCSISEGSREFLLSGGWYTFDIVEFVSSFKEIFDSRMMFVYFVIYLEYGREYFLLTDECLRELISIFDS